MILDTPAAVRHKRGPLKHRFPAGKNGSFSCTPRTSRTAPRTIGAAAGSVAHLKRPRQPMPKMKTNRAAAKRFRVTGSGRIRRSKAGLNHCMQEKSRKRLRRLRKNDMVDSTLTKRIKLLLPYG